MQKRVAIIGAGISGLTTAYYLNKRGFQVEIFESRERAGGLIHSRQTENGLVESAANGFLNSAQLESLANDIDCKFFATKKASRRRYIFRNGRALAWPLSLFETLRLITAILRYFLARSSLRPRPDESLKSWGTRILGASVSHYTIETAVQGVYAMPTDQQSATLTLKRFFEPAFGPTAKPQTRGTVAPRNGLSEFVGKLESTLISRGVSFHYNTAVDTAPSGFDATVVATSARDAGRLLRTIDDVRAHAIERVNMQGLISVTVFWPQDASHLAGFGCLFPPRNGHAALGVLMNSTIFENRVAPGLISETWIFSYSGASDDDLLALIQLERQKMHQPSAKPVKFMVARWPQALPRYDRDLEAALSQITARQSPAQPYLVGNYLGEIGLKNLLARALATAEHIEREHK